MSGTLCWECGKSCGQCSWSKHLVPVEGWDAELRVVGNPPMESYLVHSCPEYIDDSKVPKRDARRLDSNGSLLCIGAVVRQIREAYLISGPQTRASLARILMSEHMAKLTGLDMQALVDTLKREVRKTK